MSITSSSQTTENYQSNYQSSDDEEMNKYLTHTTNVTYLTKTFIKSLHNLFTSNQYNIQYKTEDSPEKHLIEINYGTKTVSMMNTIFITDHRFINILAFVYIPLKTRKVISEQTEINTRLSTAVRELNSTFMRKFVKGLTYSEDELCEGLKMFFDTTME